MGEVTVMDTGKVLLDREMDHPVVEEIRDVIETGPNAGETLISDLHVWRVGKGAYSCAISVVTHDPTLTPARIRAQLSVHEEIVHTTIEIQVCNRGFDGRRPLIRKRLSPLLTSSGRRGSEAPIEAYSRIAAIHESLRGSRC